MAAMGMGVLAHTGTWASGNKAGMSKQGDSPDCEYRRPIVGVAKQRSTLLSYLVEPAPAGMEIY